MARLGRDVRAGRDLPGRPRKPTWSRQRVTPRRAPGADHRAPFDGGISHRAGCRFGPQAIRFTDYLPHDGLRPPSRSGVDPLADLGVVDVGDVEMPPGNMELSLKRLEDAVAQIAQDASNPGGARR